MYSYFGKEISTLSWHRSKYVQAYVACRYIGLHTRWVIFNQLWKWVEAWNCLFVISISVDKHNRVLIATHVRVFTHEIGWCKCIWKNSDHVGMLEILYYGLLLFGLAWKMFNWFYAHNKSINQLIDYNKFK